jgi:hypothetical protein
MDPNETLRQMRALATVIEARMTDPLKPGTTPEQMRSHWYDVADKGDQLSTLVQAMDEWLTKGGFLPDAWRHKVRGNPEEE